MNKRLQVVLTEESWRKVEEISKNARHDFNFGRINLSDIINEMIRTSDVDVKRLQGNSVDIRRSLRALSKNKNIDYETALRMLHELKKSTSQKKHRKPGKGSPT